MTDFIQSLLPDAFERILWLAVLVILAFTRLHRMLREERRKDQLLREFLAHYSEDKVWPADAHESLRVMLHKEPIKLIDIRK